MAVASTHIGLVRALLEMGANPNGLPGEGGYTLHYALRSGNREVVDVVLEHGVAVNDLVPDQGLLATAIRMGLSDLVPVLLENGVSLNHTEQGNSPLAAAFMKKKMESLSSSSWIAGQSFWTQTVMFFVGLSRVMIWIAPERL